MNKQSIKIFVILLFSITGAYNSLQAQQNQSTPGLTPRQQSIVPIAAFTAIGELSSLKSALHEGLDAGMAINEIKEVMVQLYAYAGFLRSLNAISTLQSVVNERKKNGKTDLTGKEPSAIDFKQSRYDYGKRVQTALTGSSGTGAPQQYVPVIDTFLKEHLFADVFGRDNLDYQSREIATISALASMSGTEAQLRAHLNVGRNVGLTEKQLRDIAFTVSAKVSEQQGKNISQILNNMFRSASDGATKLTDSRTEKSASVLGVFPKGQKLPITNFTGNAWHYPITQADSLFTGNIGTVTFEAGARTNWHSHPGGQILIIVEGIGYYQEKGSAKRTIKRGETVKCPPNTPHWHGASKEEAMTHIAIAGITKGAPVWLQPVTENEYQN